MNIEPERPGKVCMNPEVRYGPGLHAWEREKRSLREKWTKEEKKAFLRECSQEEINDVKFGVITIDQLWLKKKGTKKN